MFTISSQVGVALFPSF